MDKKIFKSKISLIPFNIFWCIPTFFISDTVLSLVFKLDSEKSILIAAIIYCYEIANQCKIDWLQHQIDELKNNK